MIKINNCEYEVREMTAGDLAVIAALAPRVAHHLRPDGVDLGGLLGSWPDIMAAAEQLLQPVVKPLPPADQPVLEQVGGHPDLRELPLHEALDLLTELALAWLTLNGDYFARQVTPALTELTGTITAVAQRIKAATPPSPPPRQ